ncbi:hypothetical protein HanRHA438_Chr17g0808021 [Helianthus annuus]|nr:hypothetical protein HanRHA438_Chr17g0808021 [Helianthus annuus]
MILRRRWWTKRACIIQTLHQFPRIDRLRLASRRTNGRFRYSFRYLFVIHLSPSLFFHHPSSKTLSVLLRDISSKRFFAYPIGFNRSIKQKVTKGG